VEPAFRLVAAPAFRLVRLAAILPAALLLTVAATQMAVARHGLLSPWKGGGFGMFASIDGLPFRQVRIVVDAPGRSEEIDPPASLERLTARTATYPHMRALERLGRAVVARERRRDRPVSSVRIEVWRAGISPSLESTWQKLAEMVVHANDVDAIRAAR
jgi:hypothetical protein